jgi:hypothetical protein
VSFSGTDSVGVSPGTDSLSLLASTPVSYPDCTVQCLPQPGACEDSESHGPAYFDVTVRCDWGGAAPEPRSFILASTGALALAAWLWQRGKSQRGAIASEHGLADLTELTTTRISDHSTGA